MNKKNKVFIATSIDGFIADKNGNIDWLHTLHNPNKDDMGYMEFISGCDAIVMGRTTFETVLSFDIPWSYEIPVFVLSSQLNNLPPHLADKAHLVKGSLHEVLAEIHRKGYNQLYIDGGTTIRSFLSKDLIDEITLTTIPILLGGGAPLFGDLPQELNFELLETRSYLNQVVQRHYQRKK